MSIGGGDDIKSLPVNKERNPKPGDLEMIYNIFQPKNIPIIKSVVSPFKTAALGALLFGIFSLPFVYNFINTLCKNQIYSRLVLVLLFLVIFFMLQKVFKLSVKN